MRSCCDERWVDGFEERKGVEIARTVDNGIDLSCNAECGQLWREFSKKMLKKETQTSKERAAYLPSANITLRSWTINSSIRGLSTFAGSSSASTHRSVS